MNKADFIKICKMTQPALKTWLTNVLKAYYNSVVSEDGFIYAKGNTPVGVTAHLDTVHKSPVKKVKESKGKIASPQGIGGDDRCGVYMILKILETTELRPTIIFCEDEEIGGKGSQKFCFTEYIDDLADLLFIIEFDRANANDLVYYDDTNKDFHNFCSKATGYKTAFGSFSDISNLCPACGVSGVNISCGYYNAHTTSEFVVMSEMENSILKAIDLINEGVKAGKQFEYVPDYFSGFGRINYRDYYGYAPREDIYSNVIFFDADGGEYLYDNVESIVGAIGKLMMDNPNLSWNDIIDYEIF